MNKIDTGKITLVFSCNICTLTDTFFKWSEHINSGQLMKPDKNECHCGKTFRSRRELLKHVYDDENQKFYMCVCRAWFETWEEAVEHLRDWNCIGHECYICGKVKFCLCIDYNMDSPSTQDNSSEASVFSLSEWN